MIKNTTIYSSSNGDRWQLIQDDEVGLLQVRHEPNLSSGGQPTEVPVPEFLSRSGATPQGVALREYLEKKGAIDSED